MRTLLRRTAVTSGIVAATVLSLTAIQPAQAESSAFPFPASTDTTAPVGRVYTAGGDHQRTLGDGRPRQDVVSSTIRLGRSAARVSDISCSDHCLAVDKDGQVVGWGDNFSYDPVLTTSLPFPTWRPEVIPGVVGIEEVESAYHSSFAWDAVGRAWTWGTNAKGQLGLGQIAEQGTPVRIPGLPLVRTIISNGVMTLAVSRDGRVFGFGSPSRADLMFGPGVSTAPRTPVEIPMPGRVLDVALGNGSALARLDDGTVWAWGSNYRGQLGVDPTSLPESASPVQVPLRGTTKQVDMGGDTAFAVTANGTVFSWGETRLGGLPGDGGNRARPKPKPVPGLPPVAEVDAGNGLIHAIGTDGSLWAWGPHWWARGDGQQSKTPLRVPLPGKVVDATGSWWMSAYVVDESVQVP